MGRAHEVRAAAMAKTAAMKSKIYSRYGKEIYIAAKSGVPDPEMNLTLRSKIKEAKANQVPADVIKRAIEKAKGGSNETYDSLRYEGIGPAGATIIIDCLTDNSNRTIAAMNQCFNKSHCKLGVKGSVSFNYDNLGVLSFNFDDEDKMLDTLIEADVDVNDIEVEEGVMTVYTAPADLHKAQEAIDTIIPDCNYSVCAIKMLPQEYVKITDEHDKEMWNRLLTLLDEVDDVQEVFHNVED
ncbi:MAG: YebC/PmpR family DNA-binding transcriptional regulator [Erysipelotrichaceae bacterium]|nr:YebC/PmpR family DNA-binding transcriptional regulator [Erysipelotrichaceae bacterium]